MDNLQPQSLQQQQQQQSSSSSLTLTAPQQLLPPIGSAAALDILNRHALPNADPPVPPLLISQTPQNPQTTSAPTTASAMAALSAIMGQQQQQQQIQQQTLPPPPQPQPQPPSQQKQQQLRAQQTPQIPSTGSVGNMPSKVVSFVKKVYEMVNDASINDLISWHYDKKIPAFIVCK